MIRPVPLLLALLAFTGCSLIDRNTFAPAPEARAEQPAPAAVAPVVLDNRTPLVTIDYSAGTPDYAELLHDAVAAAEARDADVQYDVVAMVKGISDAEVGQQRASGVMKAIMRNRVPAARIHLGLRTDPALSAGQVRVYVR